MSDELDTIVAADNDKYMIRCENLVKIYKTSDVEVVALQGLDLDVERGELMAIVGNSGSGKSTLLNMLGGLDKPSAGNLYVDGKDLLKFTDKDYMEYKRNTVGFVWQNNARNLVPYLTAVQNVELPMLLKTAESTGAAGQSGTAEKKKQQARPDVGRRTAKSCNCYCIGKRSEITVG